MSHIQELRDLMSRLGADAVIIPGTDPHHSEYMADHWKFREWLTGFTGSNGTAVVTQTKALLWTDSRYFLQAELELAGSGIELMKENVAGEPTIEEWLAANLHDEDTVAIDGRLFSIVDANRLEVFCGEHGFLLAPEFYVADRLWTDRPPRPMTTVEVHDEELAGETVESKIARVKELIEDQGADSMLVASLDDIAWLFNLRGADVARTPVTIAFAYLGERSNDIFIDEQKLSPEAKAHLKRYHVGVRDYDDILRFLERRNEGDVILLDPNSVSDSLGQALMCGKVYAASPIAKLKSIKNEAQIAGFRRAHESDGVALARLIRRLKSGVASGETLTEVDVQTLAIKLRRQADADYRDESFDLIAGYADHGAIVHYTATPESAYTLKPEGLLLIDTGGQYLCGTTDVTRTIALGTTTAEQRRDYTLVLKGHLALQGAQFPRGTRGDQLDALARLPLWKEGMNFGHGTGHGVGHYLSVHEGPQSIRMDHNPTTLKPGMVTSDEPGIYRTGKHGIRVENLLLTVPSDIDSEFGEFLHFEPLTLVPYERELIDVAMLTDEERRQIDLYHRMVLDRLSPRLDGDDLAWLTEACRPL
ncbi:MAG: aminopeptidase P family protein [Muribaculaceae bacterium]|nr:aminopeptidase P family protein [Muribaculaceae bacterium]